MARSAIDRDEAQETAWREPGSRGTSQKFLPAFLTGPSESFIARLAPHDWQKPVQSINIHSRTDVRSPPTAGPPRYRSLLWGRRRLRSIAAWANTPSLDGLASTDRRRLPSTEVASQGMVGPWRRCESDALEPSCPLFHGQDVPASRPARNFRFVSRGGSVWPAAWDRAPVDFPVLGSITLT